MGVFTANGSGNFDKGSGIMTKKDFFKILEENIRQSAEQLDYGVALDLLTRQVSNKNNK